ncbi:hypothetical protein COOONC_00567 [Cooperia oncophora]
MLGGKILRMGLKSRIRQACIHMSAREASTAPECVDSEHQKISAGEGPSRSSRPVDEAKEEVLRETKKRIRRWKARNAYLSAPAEEANDDPSKGDLPRISEVDFARKAEEEEREWAERADDMLVNLSFVSTEENRAIKLPSVRKFGYMSAYRFVFFHSSSFVLLVLL